ncbi:MAG: hypothetical protein ACREHG_00030 [Candidatus Saccharimonadales bacterium]
MIVKITQEMLDATGEPIEQASIFENIQEVAFLDLGGSIAVYNLERKQTLPKRFDSYLKAFRYIIAVQKETVL